MYRVKVGENLFSEASAPSKKAARQLAAEEAVKELMADGRLQLNKVRLKNPRITRTVCRLLCHTVLLHETQFIFYLYALLSFPAPVAPRVFQ